MGNFSFITLVSSCSIHLNTSTYLSLKSTKMSNVPICEYSLPPLNNLYKKAPPTTPRCHVNRPIHPSLITSTHHRHKPTAHYLCGVPKIHSLLISINKRMQILRPSSSSFGHILYPIKPSSSVCHECTPPFCLNLISGMVQILTDDANEFCRR